MSVSAWKADPTGRHQYRWFDGEQWTDQVADDGVQLVDPVTPAEASLPHDQIPSPPSQTTPGHPPGSVPAEMLASRWSRLGARILDTIFIAVPLGIAVVIIVVNYENNTDPSENDVGFLLLFLLFGVALLNGVYEVVMTATKGQTLGKMAAGIVVVQTATLRKPSWPRSLGRWFVPWGLGWIPILGQILNLLNYLWILWDKDRQCIHDKAVDTIVIKKR